MIGTDEASGLKNSNHGLAHCKEADPDISVTGSAEEARKFVDSSKKGGKDPTAPFKIRILRNTNVAVRALSRSAGATMKVEEPLIELALEITHASEQALSEVIGRTVRAFGDEERSAIYVLKQLRNVKSDIREL